MKKVIIVALALMLFSQVNFAATFHNASKSSLFTATTVEVINSSISGQQEPQKQEPQKQQPKKKHHKKHHHKKHHHKNHKKAM